MSISPELKKKFMDLQKNISPELKQQMMDLQHNISPELKTQMAQFQQKMSPDMLEKMSQFQQKISPDIVETVEPVETVETVETVEQISSNIVDTMSNFQQDMNVEISKPNEIKQRKMNSRPEMDKIDTNTEMLENSITLLKILNITNTLYLYRTHLKYGFILLMGSISIYMMKLYNYV